MGKTFNMVGGGTNVIANPAMTGTEINLQGLEVSGTKYKVPLIRPNLLDNWYFVGGGSQQNGGKLPINQKGQTSYSANANYTIDRWTIRNNAIATVNTDYVTVQQSASNLYSNVCQIIDNATNLNGKTLTLSVICRGTNYIRCSLYNITSNASISPLKVFEVDANNFDLYSFTFGVGESAIPQGNSVAIRIDPNDPTSGLYSQIADIKAVKLELGDTQTLAHNEGTDANPVWVLNEIPNYTEELWKCQRYYQLFASSSYRPTYGEDYRPPMRLHNPTKGTISIGGTTYYYADANL